MEIDIKIPHTQCHYNGIPALIISLQLLNKDYNFKTGLLKVPIHIYLSQMAIWWL